MLLPPPADAAFVPAFLAFLSKVIEFAGITIPANPFRGLTFAGKTSVTLALEEALLESLANLLLFVDTGCQLLVEARRGKRRQCRIHGRLFRPPRALQSMGTEKLCLRSRPLVCQACLKFLQMLGKLTVLVQCAL